MAVTAPADHNPRTTMTNNPVSPATGRLPSPRVIAVNVLRALLICTGVALFITVLQGGRGFWESLVYSNTIGLGCTVFIEAGRRATARWVRHRRPDDEEAHHHWPGWPLMVPVLLLGTLAGYTLGVALGNAATGYHLPLPWELGRQAGSAGTLTFSISIGVIATYLFWLRGRLAATQARAEAAQRLAAETQLKLMESQLEPHMLFNTLANLRALIGVDPTQAQAMLDRLIDFLRGTLQATRVERHALSVEFARLADYLALMQVRMGDRLACTLDLPAELAELPVPPLLLQPLVENAIKHGLEPQRGPGRLTVRAWRADGQLHLQVRDTGRGLAAAGRDGTAAPGTGFGTQQVRERLQALFGGRASFLLSEPPEGGTSADLTLPLD
jgi:signal transduction histidine kinase